MPTLQLSQNAHRVLNARYLRRNARGAIVESPDGLFARIARAVAEAERLVDGPHEVGWWEQTYYGLMSSLSFLPNSPTLMNAGLPGGQLSACFVLPVQDSLEGIFDAIKLMALVQRTGGGTGFCFSNLRQKGAVVASTGGEASGPVSFMRVFDCATEHVKLGGRRRGANMGVLRADHPDILEFVNAKADETSLRNFNLSVSVTDDYMDRADRGQDYGLIEPHTGRCVGRLPAAEVFEAIVQSAWQTGDPGVLFLDAINRANPTPHLGPIEATNPCGEVPLLPYEACNLGSVNLARCLKEEAGREVIDWPRVGEVVEAAVRFLDDVIEVSRYPAPEIARAARRTRKIGLGVMGLAEMLIRLGVPYDSADAAAIADRVMRRIAESARAASGRLAEERGVYPAWPGSVHGARGFRQRNATLTAIAPTGTISIIAGTTPSIEPLFALAYRRRHVLGEQTLGEMTPLLAHYLDRHRLDAASLRRAVAERGTLAGVEGVPEQVRKLFVTALEIAPRDHLRIQAAFQRHTDNSVSKTINLAQDVGPAEVLASFFEAWKLGLKGVTVYRYGSKPGQVLELGAGEVAFQYDHATRCDPTECRV